MDLREAIGNTLNRHPWEISRSESLLSMLINDDKNLQYADVGSGDMYIVHKLKEYTNKPIYAIDSNYPSIKDTDGIFMRQDIKDVPRMSINRLLLFDILEHIENENSFLKDILHIMNDDGKIFITVPAFQFLFSPHDVFLKHYRRYSRSEIVDLLKKNGLKIEESFYFYTLAFLIRCLEVLLFKLHIKKNYKISINKWRYKETNFITRLMVSILNFDFNINRFLSKFNISFIGLSICVVCKKKFV